MAETNQNVIRARRRYARIGLALLLASALAPVQGRMAAAQATDENGCPSGDQWLACRARAGDPGAMYAVGRSAYETARTSHDFTEALDWARRLDKMGDPHLQCPKSVRRRHARAAPLTSAVQPWQSLFGLYPRLLNGCMFRQAGDSQCCRYFFH